MKHNKQFDKLLARVPEETKRRVDKQLSCKWLRNGDECGKGLPGTPCEIVGCVAWQHYKGTDMEAPDKLYIGRRNYGPLIGGWKSQPFTSKEIESIEYIRKEALLEWLEKKLRFQMAVLLTGWFVLLTKI